MRGVLPILLCVAPLAGLSPAPGQTVASPPPPTSFSPPPIGDCQMGPYIVFFAFNGSQVSRPASEILDNAIASDRECLRANIFLVVGHADRTGPAAANLALSRRRAAAVADYFAAHGVARSAITLRGVGESRPLVQTRVGVPNAENRYVEVYLGGSKPD